MFWGLNKTRCPGLLSLCTHALGCLLSLLKLLLNTTDGTKNWADSLLSLSEVHHLLYQPPLMWSGSSLSVCAPISLSSCLLLCLPCPYAWPTFSSSPSNPPNAPAGTHTGETPTWDYSTLSPVHPLQGALPVPRINAP